MHAVFILLNLLIQLCPIYFGDPYLLLVYLAEQLNYYFYHRMYHRYPNTFPYTLFHRHLEHHPRRHSVEYELTTWVTSYLLLDTLSGTTMATLIYLCVNTDVILPAMLYSIYLSVLEHPVSHIYLVHTCSFRNPTKTYHIAHHINPHVNLMMTNPLMDILGGTYYKKSIQ